MVNSIGISGVNPIQYLNATNAFKSLQAEVPEQIIPEFSDGIGVNQENLIAEQNMEEIKQIVQSIGEENISDDDIKYGVTYGRSVIADYVA
ncbi:MAG TPA: hypothetical protein PLG15_05950 [Candidatus Gastranaerophilaceae bacterium]|nr:hypothetical protein [Candidatus Gastranaerophilaceae bacterium]HPT41908.1 hypothetical protein [Candidatus Gastranaerophilaceae bacterium]